MSPVRGRWGRVVLWLGLASFAAGAQDLRQRHYQPLLGTAGECVTPFNGTLVRIDDPAFEVPLDRAHLRVSHWGDPGTAESVGAIERAVQSLVIEGAQLGFWRFRDAAEAAPFIDAYRRARRAEVSTDAAVVPREGAVTATP